MPTKVYSYLFVDHCPKCAYVKYLDEEKINKRSNISKYCKGNSIWPWAICAGIELEHLHCKCPFCGSDYLTEVAEVHMGLKD